jgi:hypothetical protein
MERMPGPGRPKPLALANIQTYSRSVKAAQINLRFNTGTLSRKALDLLAECCQAERLPATVPNYLEIHELGDTMAYVLAKPTMIASESTIPLTETKEDVRVDLTKLLAAQEITPVPGARMVIPVESVNLPDWGAGLVIHFQRAETVPIRRRGKRATAD